MVFLENQLKKTYTFKYMLLQPKKSDLILAIIKEVESHYYKSHWKSWKIVVINKHKNKYGKLKNILTNLVFQAQNIPIWKINLTQRQTLCK